MRKSTGLHNSSTFSRKTGLDIDRGRPGEIIQKTFGVRNLAFSELIVKSVKTTCGCTVAELPSKTIATFATLELPVSLNLSGKQGAVNVSVNMDFENHEPIELKIYGEVIEEHPVELSFGEFKRGELVASSFVLRSFSGEKLSVVDATVDTSLFSVEFTPISEGRETEVNIVTIECPGYGAFDGLLEITTDDTEVPKKEIRLKGYVYPRLIASARRVSLGLLTSRKTVTRSIKIVSPYGEPLRLESFESSNPLLDIEAGIPLQDGSIPISISTKEAPTSPGVFQGELVFQVYVGKELKRLKVEIDGLTQVA